MQESELIHPYLVHPRTGEPLRAVARHPLTGRPVWPIMGGDGSEDDANEDGNEDEGTESGDEDADESGADGDEKDADKGEDSRVKRANKDAAKYRTQLRTTQAELNEAKAKLDKLVKALGGDDENDDAEAAEKAAGKVADLEAEKAALQAELLVTRLAPKHKGNADALLDSQKFTKALAGLDPADDDYEDQVAEAIKDAVAKNAAYRIGQGSSRGGSELDPDAREKNTKRAKGLGAAIGAAYNGRK
jgi:hypothetical protein